MKGCYLTRPKDFARVHSCSKWSGTALIGIKSCSNGLGVETRYGLIVSKRVGGAVERNRVKRRLREISRQLRPVEGMDILLSARTQAAQVDFETLKASVVVSLQRRNLLAEND
ncbi:MAG: ribonuclease P protein component [Dehalococcoidia bacterium]|nr:ribonuclease P protein component [Dehalococcoidia bacterium]